MSSEKTILVINPGSTSTKVALYQGKHLLNQETLEHTQEELSRFPSVFDQTVFRKEAIEAYLVRQNCPVTVLNAIAARGGAVQKMESGAYLVDEPYLQVSSATQNPHVASLACIIGSQLAQEAGTGIPTFIYDAVSGCGKPAPIYTISGSALVERPFFCHVLNTRAVCRLQAELDNVPLAGTTYIAVHLGGGISVNLMTGGEILDIVGDDEGTFSPERAGRIPCRALVRMCYSGKYTQDQVQKALKGQGGLVSYLGTTDIREVEARIDTGDEYAKLIYDAMVLQLSKDIASLAPITRGKIDKIILTGGMAYSRRLTDALTQRVSFLAPVSILPGSHEMEALAFGILRVLDRKESYHLLSGETRLWEA